MTKDILKDDLIAPQKLHIVLLTFLAALSIWMLWAGFHQYSQINHFLNGETFNKQNDDASLEVGNILLSRIKIPYNDSTAPVENKLYASVRNLDQPPPKAQQEAIVARHRIEKQPVYGLAGAPSFAIKPADISFWRWQMYGQTLLNFGGLFLISLVYIAIYEFSYRRNKLFVIPIKNTVLSAGFLLIIGAMIKWGLSFRLMHFLNAHYYTRFLDARYPGYLIYIALPVMILGAWLEQAVRLQKEQDLTI